MPDPIKLAVIAIPYPAVPAAIAECGEKGIPVLLVQSATMEAVDRIEQAYSRTRLGQPEKLEAFIKLMEEHADTEAIFSALDVA